MNDLYGPDLQVNDLAPILERLTPCTDGNCPIRHNAVHTNGGCKCLHWLSPRFRRLAGSWLRARRSVRQMKSRTDDEAKG